MNRQRKILGMVAALGLMSLVAISEEIKVPQLLNYQGFLADSQGKALSGTYQVTFTLYDHPTDPAAGHIKWSETRSVTVQGGQFAILLGQVQPIPSALFQNNVNLYLSVRVGNNAEMAPRYQIASVGFAHQAQHSEVATTFSEPKGIIAMFKSSCPTGWKRVSELDGMFIRGGTQYQVVGGSTTHSHNVDITSGIDINWHSPSPGKLSYNTDDWQHQHRVQGSTASSNWLPPYATIIFCEKQ